MAISDEIAQRLTEIEQAVKNNQQVNWEQVKVDFEASHKAYTDAQIREKMDARPLRRTGTLIGADGQKISDSNRYHGFLSAFAKDGFHKWGHHKTQPIDLWMARQLLAKANHYQPSQVKGPSEDLEIAVKALTSTGAATGDEYVPTDMADQVWMDMFLASKVAGTLLTVPMTSDPFDWPLGLGSVVWRKGTQNTATTHSDPATAKSTFTTTELVTEQRWSYTLDEDAVVAMMPLLRAEITRSAGEMIDDFAINADSTNAATGNINLDDADPADDSYYLSDGQDGLRHQWIVDNTAQTVNAGGDALVDADLTSAFKLQDKYAVDPQSNIILCDVSTYLAGLLPLTNVFTVDKFGPSAVILTGQLAAYRGVPIIPSSQHRKAEADGKQSTTAANNTLGSITLYNRLNWGLGFRRQVLIEVDRLIQARQLVMVTSFREAIGARGARSTNVHTSGIRNILV